MANSRKFAEAMLILDSLSKPHHTVIMATDVIWTDKIPTAGTDGVYVYANPDFFRDTLTTAGQRAFVLAHESAHIILRHPQRTKVFEDRGYHIGGSRFEPRLYNCAGDYVINDDLIALGFEMPELGLLDDRFTRDDMVDSVYQTLLNDQDQDSDQGDDQGDEQGESGQSGDQGSGAGQTGSQDSTNDSQGDDQGQGNGDPQGSQGEPSEGDTGGHGGFDHHLTPQYEGTAEEIELAEREDELAVQRAVDRGIEMAEQHGQGVSKAVRGSGTASSVEVDVDWYSVLADRFKCAGAGGETDWSQINVRRYTNMGVISPQQIGTLNRVAITIDISSSVNTDARDKFLSATADLLSEMQVREGALVMFTNSLVVDTVNITDPYAISDLDIPTGGGTYMASSIDYLDESGEEADIHLVFTDGDLYLNDWDRLAERDCVVVLDRQPTSWVQRDIDRVGADTIVCA